MKTLQKGFTLIELLVVIAIIGILSSIVLASLSSARSKGSDAAITSTLSNMRAQAELYYSNYNNYTHTSMAAAANCSTGTNTNIFGTTTAQGSLKTLTDDLITKAGGATNTSCIASTSAWIVAAKLSTGVACADSSGTSKSSSTAQTAAALVNASTGTCN